MAFDSKITDFFNRRYWVIPVMFGVMCAILLASIVSVEIVGVNNLSTAFAFNIACELVSMFVGVAITLSIVPAYKRQNGYIRIFVTLIFFLCLTIALDIAQALVDARPELRILNLIIAVCVFINEANVIFFFWLYARNVLKSKGKVISILNIGAVILLLAFVVIPIINGFTQFYFYVGDDGVYHRIETLWDIFARSYHLYIAVITVVAIILSKEKIKTRIIIFAFIGLPIISLLTREMKTGTAIEYAAMMVSVVLMFAFLFAGNERDLYSTNKELGLATNIQKHMLPSIFPAFPERKEFDVYALMDPAKEVGGDFYDFFLIDDTHLGLVMADVSDKGVPAALFMMASKIMVQNYALMGYSPKEVLTRVNKQICSNNQDEMFVTIWLGVLDLKTGILTAANAGHEKPILKQPHGHFEVVDDKHNFVVGFFKDTIYTEYQLRLERGAKLFVYTDGVVEARDKNSQFGMQKTLETLVKYEDLTPEEISKNLLSEVMTFIGENTQFDDITMLCLEFKGYEDSVKRLTIPADNDKISLGIDPILEFLEELKVDQKIIYKIQLALEEILVNVASYAYYPDEGKIYIEYELLESPRMIAISIIDEGKAFNPLQREDPDISLPGEEREIGGLGIFIVKNTMDEVEYERVDNKNILKIKKKI